MERRERFAGGTDAGAKGSRCKGRNALCGTAQAPPHYRRCRRLREEVSRIDTTCTGATRRRSNAARRRTQDREKLARARYVPIRSRRNVLPRAQNHEWKRSVPGARGQRETVTEANATDRPHSLERPVIPDRGPDP